ncbi:hypothetical protein X798_06690 [Onchocerca flexuosa]|uniref:Protein kinase domain-containing protein n=2 Tax=Onchocerca flexuosa TaxID=387005 RepID=A0A183HDR4_9BILA|nr:hypothetical protein X798_06690 [Onchocerca flexuosa]VDO43781.1 unnamed protein product [Onchocerca flexuosa]
MSGCCEDEYVTVLWADGFIRIPEYLGCGLYNWGESVREMRGVQGVGAARHVQDVQAKKGPALISDRSNLL